MRRTSRSALDMERGGFYFPSDASTEWLDRVDAVIAVEMLRRHREPRRAEVLEIGVWLGGWTTVVLMNTVKTTVVGVDPYPEAAADVRPRMLARVESLGLSDRFRLLDSTDLIPPGSRFQIVHVDGDHSESAVESDLAVAVRHLAPDGVIVVDDISHKWLPGVASATYRALERYGLRMFLLTPAKGYLARAEQAPAMLDLLSSSLAAHPSVRLARSYQEMTGHPYGERSEILGQPVLLARGRGSESSVQRWASLRRRWTRATAIGRR